MLTENKHDKIAESILSTGPHAVTVEDIRAARAAGLSWIALFQLAAMFVTQLPMLFQLIGQLQALLKKPGGITQADIVALESQYAPIASAMINAILTFLGVSPKF